MLLEIVQASTFLPGTVWCLGLRVWGSSFKVLGSKAHKDSNPIQTHNETLRALEPM